MTTLFISDLHLEADRPEIGEQFLDFLDDEAADAEALYILGDLCVPLQIAAYPSTSCTATVIS